MCTCSKLQKRTAARRYKIMHLRVRSSPVPGGAHLRKAAKTNSSTRLSHELFTLGGRFAGGVPLRERQMQGLCSDPVVACVQMGEASKTRNATTKARRSTISIHTGVLASNHASQPTVRRARGISSATRKHSKNACALAEWL